MNLKAIADDLRATGLEWAEEAANYLDQYHRTPAHPTTLTTEQDYENAPVGTIVVEPTYLERVSVKRVSNIWTNTIAIGSPTNSDMADRGITTVLRWGVGNENRQQSRRVAR